MKASSILVGLLLLVIIGSLYLEITNGFASNRQALIAGGLSTLAVGFLLMLFVKSRAKQAD